MAAMLNREMMYHDDYVKKRRYYHPIHGYLDGGFEEAEIHALEDSSSIMEELAESLDDELEDSKSVEKSPDGRLELIAWYVSYHYMDHQSLKRDSSFSERGWGIYFKLAGLKLMAQHYWKFRKVNKFTTRMDAVRAARDSVLCHETFHYLVDVAATLLEQVTQKRDLYVDYHRKVYSKYYDQGVMEEALANCCDVLFL